ncbi:MAG: Lrp/AsnC family transcriptional regulator [Gammaproteobacteria bacterium]|nr:Lrp/AsnC family transcriptional regulator [Gammaproteobacteria bacterium]
MPIPTLDHTDREILHHLQQDGRLTNAELAERVHLSPSPCLRRVRHLESEGIIRSYATLLDPRKVGLPISVFVNVSLRSQGREAIQDFEAHIQTCPEVMECYLMTGTSDYLLRVVVPDLDAYEVFLSSKLTTIGAVANIQSSFSLKQVVYRTELPIPQ